MAQSELLAVVRRPLSPDTQIEVPASRDEFEHVQGILERENMKYPSLQYDGWRKVAIVVAVPSPLHGQMAGSLTGRILGTVYGLPGLDANIKGRFDSTSDMSNTTLTGDTLSTRNWDGALRYLTSGGYTLMIAVEVGTTQTYRSLRAAISYSVCALHCRLGIAMSINERSRGTIAPLQYYSTTQEWNTAVQQAERNLRTELRNNPYGPLAVTRSVWYGRVGSVVVETYRQAEETCPPQTILEPTHSFRVVENGQFVGSTVPENLAELKLDDCIPTHVLSGDVITDVPINFFSRDWFEQSFGEAMLETALERIKHRYRIRPA
ncbi:hypothetical protein V1525DRAFT_427156 [Lipomyces kononenkoae]|uniref:Uncharacterized protein n=1 Tax=Lipomyces kononenkoae TaxID=34357 RepID=A0ACC3SXE1_LIPKO